MWSGHPERTIARGRSADRSLFPSRVSRPQSTASSRRRRRRCSHYGVCYDDCGEGRAAGQGKWANFKALVVDPKVTYRALSTPTKLALVEAIDPYTPINTDLIAQLLINAVVMEKDFGETRAAWINVRAWTITRPPPNGSTRF
jgi:hypothetical protein